MSKNVICTKCGWIHFPVSLEYVQKWEDEWVVYWATLDFEGKDAFGVHDRPPKKEDSYLNCFCCRESYKDMREITDSDKVPYGSTIQPILDRNEDV